MKSCKICNLSYNTPLAHCLFCNNQLEDSEHFSKAISDYYYPQFKRQKRAKRYFKKILSFLIIVALFTCLFLDLTVTGRLSWSLYTNSSLMYALYIGFLFTGKKKMIKKITLAAYASVLFLLVIGLFGESTIWATDFILPLGLLTINICLTTYFLTRRRKALHDIAVYNLTTSCLGLIPLLLILLHKLTFKWPSLICGLYSLAILFGLLFFTTKETKDEFKRRFHL